VKRRTLAVLFEFACRGAAGLVLAAPITAAVAASGLGAFPEGDRLLFEPGGLLLVEVARASWHWLGPLANASLLTLAVVSLALSVPAALLWVTSAEEDDASPPVLFSRACALVPSLLALEGVAFLGQILTLCLGFAAAGWFRSGLENPVAGDRWALLPLACAALLALGLGIVRDVASASVTCGAPNARSGLRAALAVVAGAPGTLLTRWLRAALAALALVAAVAGAVGAVDVGRPGALRVVAVAVLHQSVVLALSVFRAGWFTGAARVVRAQLGAGSEARR
jgi:hypothetical protein